MDTNFRKGMRGEERIVIALQILCGSKRFHIGAADWERGTTTAWECLYHVVDAIIEKLTLVLVKFLQGEMALQESCSPLQTRRQGRSNGTARSRTAGIRCHPIEQAGDIAGSTIR